MRLLPAHMLLQSLVRSLFSRFPTIIDMYRNVRVRVYFVLLRHMKPHPRFLPYWSPVLPVLLLAEM